MADKKFFLWPVVAGVLCATSYPPFPAWALFFCFAPLWLTWWRAKFLKEVFLTGFICQFVLTLLGFYWTAHTVEVYGHVPFPLNILVLLGFCCIANLHVPLAGVLTFFIHRRWNFTPVKFFITAALFHGLLQYFMPSVFPWNLGYSLYFSHLQTAQLAEFVGFNMLSIYVLLLNALFAFSIYSFGSYQWKKPLIFFLVVITTTEVLGFLTVQRLPSTDKTISVLIDQTNIKTLEEYYLRYGNQYDGVVTDLMLKQVEDLLKIQPKPDFIAWPEDAFPDVLDPFSNGGVNQQKLFTFLRQHQVGLLTGGFSQDFSNTRASKDYSAIFAYDNQGQLKGLYRKNILLAFGEYIPGASLIPFLKKLIPEIGDIGRGPGPAVIRINDLVVSPVICYESIHSDYVTASSNQGSHVIFNATIDSWYGKFSEQWQHFIESAGRAIELRKPVIRATNTGYSAVIDVKGKVLALSPLFQQWGKTVEVPYYSSPRKTVYSQIYKYLPWVVLTLVMIWILSHIVGHVKRRNRLA